MASEKVAKKKQTLLGYELTSHQDALVNYLIPSIGAYLLYSFLVAFDVAVIIFHNRNDDPIWASLTLFFMFLPSLGSFIIIVSNWELWPEFEGCGRENMKWFFIKVAEHLFFPAWNMWRFAERIFWSIEAFRAKNEQAASQAIEIINSPRSIELYIFLQSYTHSLLQILFQLFILIRHNATIDRQRENAQIISILLHIARISMTTTYYQRFRSQKLTGKQYPWYKQYKATRLLDDNVVLRKDYLQSRDVIEKRRNSTNLEDSYKLDPPSYSERRRSSDIYLEPSTSYSAPERQTLLETDFDEVIQTKAKIVNKDDSDKNNVNSDIIEASTDEDLTRKDEVLEGRDEVDEPRKSKFFGMELNMPPHLERLFSRGAGLSGRSEPDFNISRIIEVKGLEDDDMAGKLVAFLWWYLFLLARVLAISIFAYFFLSAAVGLLSFHYILVLAILLYDVKSDAVQRAKAPFFLFLGYIYIFCIIEFKIKFKKSIMIYYGYFFLVFAENIAMCSAWYIGRVESLENDYWFRYVFYIIIGCSLISFSTMVFYLIVNKPPKVVVETKLATSKK